VLDDLRNRYLTEEQARTVYGLPLAGAGLSS
jgi:hypothetical protein